MNNVQNAKDTISKDNKQSFIELQCLVVAIIIRKLCLVVAKTSYL